MLVGLPYRVQYQRLGIFYQRWYPRELYGPDGYGVRSSRTYYTYCSNQYCYCELVPWSVVLPEA